MIESLLLSRNDLLERRVLSKMLVTKRVLHNVAPDYFVGKNKALFDDMLVQWTKHKTIDTKILRDNHDVFTDILDVSGTDSDAAIQELRTHWQRRVFGKAIGSIPEEMDIEEAIHGLQEEIADILAINKDGGYVHSQEVARLLDIVEKNQTKKGGIAGESISLPTFDDYLNGLERGKFYILAALKKTGKSRFMVYAARQLCMGGCGVLINSLEMNRIQLNTLALSYHSGVNSRSISGGKMTTGELLKTSSAWGILHDNEWCICRDYTVSDLRSRIVYMQQKEPVHTVFIDFIQRMRDPRFQRDRVREVESIAQQLADMSRELDVCVIALSQLAGRAEAMDPEKIPDMSYVKESQGIAENADAIIIMHNPARHESPMGNDGAYRFPQFKFLIEQRYDISGRIADVDGDMRCCNFFEGGQF